MEAWLGLPKQAAPQNNFEKIEEVQKKLWQETIKREEGMACAVGHKVAMREAVTCVWWARHAVFM